MIITLAGENDSLRQQALQELTSKFVAEYGDMGLERLDGEEADYARIHEAAQSLPFLAARKLVIVRRPSNNKEFVERLEQFLDDIAETNDVVLIEPKLDKRTAYYKLLQKLTDFREHKVLDGAALANYIRSYAREQGGEVSAVDARLLIDRVGANQLALQHEVDKLLAYDPKITRGAIELLTERTPQNNIFALLDAAFAGDAKRVTQLYDEQRAARVEPQQVLAMLVWQLHLLAIVKAAGQKGADTVAREAKISPFTVRKTQGLARRISLQRLRSLITELRVFDVRLKSESLSADETVRYYLLALASQ